MPKERSSSSLPSSSELEESPWRSTSSSWVAEMKTSYLGSLGWRRPTQTLIGKRNPLPLMIRLTSLESWLNNTMFGMSPSSMSEPFPPTNSNESGDKYKGMLMTGGGDGRCLRTWLQHVLHPCDTCVLIFRRAKGQRDGGLTKVGVARRQRGQRRVCRRYASWYSNWGTIPSACGVLILYIGNVQ